MIIFLSFFQKEKDKNSGIVTSIISISNNSNLQAIIGPTISTPESGFHPINTNNAKVACLDCCSNREFIFHNLISSYFHSSQDKLLFNNPVIGLIFPQKVPDQGKEDNIPSIT